MRSEVGGFGFCFTHDTTCGKMPVACGYCGMKALITRPVIIRTVNTVIIAIKILISLMSVSIVLARMGPGGGP